MPRLVEASHWVFFDVLARNEAAGAHVAMELRERLRGASVRSVPDRARSEDSQRPHLLHCRAAAPGQTAADTREALEATLGGLAALAGPDARARVVFTDTPAQQARVAAA
jgi:hypothetical protein